MGQARVWFAQSQFEVSGVKAGVLFDRGEPSRTCRGGILLFQVGHALEEVGLGQTFVTSQCFVEVFESHRILTVNQSQFPSPQVGSHQVGIAGHGHPQCVVGLRNQSNPGVNLPQNAIKKSIPRVQQQGRLDIGHGFAQCFPRLIGRRFGRNRKAGIGRVDRNIAVALQPPIGPFSVGRGIRTIHRNPTIEIFQNSFGIGSAFSLLAHFLVYLIAVACQQKPKSQG